MTISGTRLLVVFFGGLFAWLGLVVLLAWWGSETVIRPPWHEPRSPEAGLRDIGADDFLNAQWSPGLRDPMADFGLGFENVSFEAPDGSTLRGWWVPGAAEATAGVVAVHGAAADRRDWLRHLPFLHEAGYPVLLFDCREHGISDGQQLGISFGVREHEDVMAAAAWARKQRGLERVAVLGTSQGGASVILASARAPETIDAVIAESPFTSVAELLRDTEGMQQAGHLAPLMARFALLRLGSGAEQRPIDRVAEIGPRPLLLMHGTKDGVVPIAHSERLFAAAAEPKELWILEGAGHSALFNHDPEAFAERVTGFLAKAIGPPAD